jgi:hypothetical protein
MTATAARMSSARMSATWMAATWTSTAGSSGEAGSTAARSPDSWMSAGPSHVTAAMSAVPATPSGAAAPAEAATKRITAPIEARSAPAIVVPAVISSTEDELSLFRVARDCPRREGMGGQCVGLANRTEQNQRNRGRCGQNPLSHGYLPYCY